jgi:hypothetical protein
MPGLAQEEEFIAPDGDAPFTGYTRSDGTVVLTDESFCRYLLGSLWADQELTFVKLLDKTKKQKKARRAAFEPGSDESAVAACAALLTAHRAEAPAEDALAAWARGTAVVPEALAALLPEDFDAEPLASPDEIGDAARTSGFGDLVSAPFSVAPGPWLAELDASACERWEGTLRDARDPEAAFPLAGSREYLYELDAGHYYWDVTASDCDWSVDLVPVELGPEPTATPEPRTVVPALVGTDWRREPEPFLGVVEAREALLDAGLAVGECIEEAKSFERRAVHLDRVWAQDPIPGSLVEPGSAVDVWVTSSCDIVLGDRVVIE